MIIIHWLIFLLVLAKLPINAFFMIPIVDLLPTLVIFPTLELELMDDSYCSITFFWEERILFKRYK